METSKAQKKKKWFLPLVLSLLLSTFLIFITVFTSSSSASRLYKAHVRNDIPHFVESKIKVSDTNKDPVPRLAYLISGSMGDGESLKRTLKALYHPRNQYAVHLDLEASAEERLELVKFVRNEPCLKSWSMAKWSFGGEQFRDFNLMGFCFWLMLSGIRSVWRSAVCTNGTGAWFFMVMVMVMVIALRWRMMMINALRMFFLLGRKHCDPS